MVVRITQHNKIMAKNFIHEEAKKRLHEIVEAAQQISHNSIFVHANEILYFSKIHSGIKCACREKPLANNMIPVAKAGSSESEIELDLTSPLFGEVKSQSDLAESIYDDDIVDGDSSEVKVNISSLFGNATECPICFRVGTIPGYQPIGHSRQVFSSVNIENSDGYYLNSSEPISVFECENKKTGFVEFKLTVPLIFHGLQFACYNKRNVLDKNSITLNGFPISEVVLYSHKGKDVTIKVREVDFTHVVFQFKISKIVVKADFPQDQKPRDYNIFDSTQPVSIITDNTIPSISYGDIVIKVGHKNMWKVNDYEFFRMNDKTVIGWNLQARLVQQDEISTMLNVFD